MYLPRGFSLYVISVGSESELVGFVVALLHPEGYKTHQNSLNHIWQDGWKLPFITE